MWTGTWFASSTFSTPTWANPLAAPAPSTRATFGATRGASTGAGFTSRPAQEASSRSRSDERTTRGDRRPGIQNLRLREQDLPLLRRVEAAGDQFPKKG